MPVAEYLGTRIWQPMGAEADASWSLDASGQEVTFAFMHATLRDYARLGVLLANDGRGQRPPDRGGRLVARGDASRRAACGADGGNAVLRLRLPSLGLPGRPATFRDDRRARQVIYVDTEAKLVMVQTAVWKTARD